MMTEMRIELKEMKRRTPVDTRPNAPHPGNLRDSLRLTGPIFEGKEVSVIAHIDPENEHESYIYGVYVHEDPEAFHPIGQWKYIESVLMESRSYIAGRIAERIRRQDVRAEAREKEREEGEGEI